MSRSYQTLYLYNCILFVLVLLFNEHCFEKLINVSFQKYISTTKYDKSRRFWNIQNTNGNHRFSLNLHWNSILYESGSTET